MRTESTSTVVAAAGRPKTTAGLWAFLMLAFGGAWLCFAPAVAAAAGYAPAWLANGAGLLLLVGLGSFAPAAAALWLDRAQGPGAWRRLLQRLRPRRADLGWYAVAIAVGLATPSVAALGGALGTDGDIALPSVTVWLQVLGALVTVQLLFGAVGEEPGWRGYALPYLIDRLGPLRSGLVLGGIWWAWHLPLFAIPAWTVGKGTNLVGSMLWFLLLTVSLSMVMAWGWSRVGGHLLPLVLFHDAVNTGLGLVPAVVPGTRQDVLTPAAIGFAVLALVLVTYHLRARRG